MGSGGRSVRVKDGCGRLGKKGLGIKQKIFF